MPDALDNIITLKEKGYPFDHSGCTVDQIFAKTGKDVRADQARIE
jgi:hypothetical protein